jgi:hypothetical protein
LNNLLQIIQEEPNREEVLKYAYSPEKQDGVYRLLTVIKEPQDDGPDIEVPIANMFVLYDTNAANEPDPKNIDEKDVSRSWMVFFEIWAVWVLYWHF